MNVSVSRDIKIFSEFNLLNCDTVFTIPLALKHGSATKLPNAHTNPQNYVRIVQEIYYIQDEITSQ